MIVVILSIYFMIYIQNKRIISFDESNDTTEDYSIEITVRSNDYYTLHYCCNFFQRFPFDVHSLLKFYIFSLFSARIPQMKQEIQMSGKNSLNQTLKMLK